MLSYSRIHGKVMAPKFSEKKMGFAEDLKEIKAANLR